MPADYLPVLILVVMAGAFAGIALIVPALLGPHKPNDIKLFPYEGGKIPFVYPWDKRISISYYMVAMLFVLFDIVVIFMFPWAVMLRSLRLFGLLAMGVFLLIMLVGYVYIRRKGALEWD